MDDAERLARVTAELLATFKKRGYRLIDPPLMEFEDTLLAGPGAAVAKQTFRLMDPLSYRMMGVRADMTPQISRMALSRLKDYPRPLRLCYAGDVVRAYKEKSTAPRQIRQIGCELIGAATAHADAEIIRMAVAGLNAIGIDNVIVDLTLGALMPLLCHHYQLGAKTPDLIHAIQAKDEEKLATFNLPVFEALLAVSGNAAEMLEKLKAITLPDIAQPLMQTLIELVPQLDGLTVSIDLLDHSGFEYYSGFGFTLFAKNIAQELGRGGRYCLGTGLVENCAESGIGFSYDTDVVLSALGNAITDRTIYLPHDSQQAIAADLQQQGWITVAALAAEKDSQHAARELKCHAIWQDGKILEL